MKKHVFAFTTIAALSIMGAYAVAKSGDGEARPTKMSMMDEKMEQHFLAMDANHDGLVSEKEMIAFVTAKAKADFAKSAGPDHMLTPEEFKAMHKARHEEMMKDMMKSDDSASDDKMDSTSDDDKMEGMDHDQMDHSKMDH